MSPLACCDDCPDKWDCVEEGCMRSPHRAGPRVITLNEEQWNDFVYHMTHPKEPTPEMKAAARLMAEFAAKLNAAPQPSIAIPATAPSTTASSQEGVGQGDVAAAAPDDSPDGDGEESQ